MYLSISICIYLYVYPSLVDIGSHIDIEPPIMPELGLHWLAVDGIQPIIPENPLPALMHMHRHNTSNTNNNTNTTSNTNKKSIRLFSEMEMDSSTGVGMGVDGEKDEHAFPTLLSTEMQVCI